VMFGLTGQEADIKSLEQTVVLKLQEITKLKAEVAALQAERDSLEGDIQRIYDNCSDTDLIIDIAIAALEDKWNVESGYQS
jgi:cell division protein FtsB